MSYFICDPLHLTIDAQKNYLVCEDANGVNMWQQLTQAEADAWVLGIVQSYNQSAMTVQDLIVNVDPAVVEAIFGAGLFLFVTGLGAGWLVNIIRQAR